jgi:Ran GTPase-activating protein (RanGAP) involved in mRNA processing and transport
LSTIRAFRSDGAIPWESADTLMSTLASLPSLEDVTLGFFGGWAYCALRELTNLVKSPSLRSIEFSETYFTSDGSKALLAAFEGGSFTTLRLTRCDLGDSLSSDLVETIRMLVQALKRNMSVKTLSLVGNSFDELFYEGITMVLLVNTTLVDLTLQSECGEENGGWLQPLFIAMQVNKSLKSLEVDTFDLTDESVCGALRDALANNSVLESLTLHSARLLNDTSVISWRKTLPFIRDNATLKSLKISFINEGALDPHIATLCFDTVVMLESNTTLECLDIKSRGISPDAYFAALESLQPNTALKTLRLSPVLASMGDDKMEQLVSLVTKNYSLAVLDEDLSTRDKTGELGTLLRLNKVGRRYLIKDAASIAKGVEVLIGVSDDLDCLFYHLLENPTLCDIDHQYGTKSEMGVHVNKRQRV